VSRPFSNDREGEGDAQEPVVVTDKRRIDPVTGEVRATGSGPAPSGPAPEPEVASSDAPAAVSDEVADLTATLQRVKAEYDNYRKRSVRQEQAAADRAKALFAGQLLPVLDDLDNARNHGDLESGPLKAVADKLIGALEGVGLVGFGAEGDAFDPSLHEAVQHEGDGSNPVVGTVMRRGYKFGDNVLRHALVGVVDAPADSDTAENAGGSVREDSESSSE
jgi:molecular chaperone GrpE